MGTVVCSRLREDPGFGKTPGSLQEFPVPDPRPYLLVSNNPLCLTRLGYTGRSLYRGEEVGRQERGSGNSTKRT